MKKISFFSNDTKRRVLALVLAATTALSGLQTIPALAADGVLEAGGVEVVSDPMTTERLTSVYGQNTQNAGKVTVDKSVSTEDLAKLDGVDTNIVLGDNDFLVTLSQSAQAMGLASKIPVPIDAVFVLDTSGSMKDSSRYTKMITAANEAIATLMAANAENRIAVVAFSSKNYGEGTSDGAAANVLSELDHYSDDAASTHLQRVDKDGNTSTLGEYVAGRKKVEVTVQTNPGGKPGQGGRPGQSEETTKEVNAYRNAKDGGTNIQAGIALGASLLMDSTKTTTATIDGKTYTRMPVIIVLSDGVPTYSSSATEWYDAAEVGEEAQQGPGDTSYPGNGYLAAMTAAYFKGKITERYYGEKASEENHCNIYTVGVSVSNDDLATMTLNPKDEYRDKSKDTVNGRPVRNNNDYYETFKGYMDSYSKGTDDFSIKVNRNTDYTVSKESISTTKNYVNGKREKDGKVYNMYTGGIQYNDAYFKTDDSTNGLSDTFKELVRLIQIKAISYPTNTEVSADFGGYVHFYDTLGEYMEVKDVHGIVANNYFFQGATFAQKMLAYGTAGADKDFDAAVSAAMNGRLELANGKELTDAELKALVDSANRSANQLYYKNASDYDNSICWWGKSYQNGDEQHMQYISFADDDSADFVEQAVTNNSVPEGADYVCRSYYYYGTAGGQITAKDDFLLMVVRVQRSLTAPYQQTVYVSIPASLLSVDRVLVTEDKTKNPTEYEAFVQEEKPVHILYEVGLQEGINAQNVSQKLAGSAYVAEKTSDYSAGSKDNYDAATDTYYFYTNDWDRTKSVSSHERASTRAGFDAAEDNDYYTFTEDTVLYTKNGNAYTPLTGAAQPNTTYYYKVTYYDWSGSEATTVTSGKLYDCTPKEMYRAIQSPNDTKVLADNTTQNGTYTCVKKGVYKYHAISSEIEDTVKTANNTATSTVVTHPEKLNKDATESHYRIYLGNNGRLALRAEDAKTVAITKADGTTTITNADGKAVTVGDVLTYSIKVVNAEDQKATATVTDVVPTGTTLVEGSITDSGSYNTQNNTITWTLANLAPGEEKTVSFKVTVTEAALQLESYSVDNSATIKIGNSPAYKTNTVTNPPQGKRVSAERATDADTKETVTGDLQVGDRLVYTIRWANDSDAKADITIKDALPTGTTIDGTYSHGGVYDITNHTITWVLRDIEPGKHGEVSFAVRVDESAKTPLANGATIKIGTNGPEFKTNTTSNNIATGNLKLKKTVAVETGTGSNADTFTLKLTAKSAATTDAAKLNRKFAVVRSTSTQADEITFQKGVATITIQKDEVIEIKELPAGLTIKVEEINVPGGFTASYTPNTQEVTVLPSAQGTVEATVANTYHAAKTSVALEGTKTLTTNYAVGNIVFSFELYQSDKDGKVAAGATALNTAMATVSSTSKEMSFKFAALDFTAPGDYYYLVKETAANVTGVTYDTTQYLVKISVTDNGAGQLTATTSCTSRAGGSGAFTTEPKAIVFTNHYEPKEVSLTLEGTKTLSGRALKAGEFSFVVTEGTQSILTGTSTADGKIALGTITYYAPCEHTYKIYEVPGGDSTITYDGTEYTVYVKVEDVDGQLTITNKTLTKKAAGSETGETAEKITFANTYTPSEVAVTLTAKKNYTDQTGEHPLTANKFLFNAYEADSNGNVAAGAQPKALGYNDANGNVTFGSIYYALRANTTTDYTDTYYYKVTEAIPDISKAPRMDYDETAYLATVTVTYTHSTGELKAEVTSIKKLGVTEGTNPTVMTFTNTRYPDTVQVTPVGTKTTTVPGTDSSGLPSNITFSFSVINTETGNEVYSGTAGASTTGAAIKFTPMSFDKEGEYKYWLVETNAGNTTNGITYDQNRYLMTVTVTSTNGKLEASVKYYGLKAEGTVGNVADYTVELTDGAVPTFTNAYAAKGYINLTATKSLTGATLQNQQFDFRLNRVDGESVSGKGVTGTNDANGVIRFATLYYSMEDMGGANEKIIHYVMSEDIPTINPLPGVTYDSNKYDVYVKLTHDGAGNITAQLCDKDGNIKTTVNADGSATPTTDTGVTFSNSYAVKTGTDITFTVKKELTGRALQAGEFEFVWSIEKDGQLIPIETATNAADGTVTFTHTYPATTKPGTYKYVISESNSGKGGVTYDTKTYVMYVNLEDVNAVLNATYSIYESDGTTLVTGTPTFTNTYTASDVTFTAAAKKELTGRALQADEFDFVIAEESGKVVATGKNTAAGSVSFTGITYKHSDLGTATSKDFVYTIKEADGKKGGVVYDSAVYYLKVTLSDDGNGVLTATGKYYKDQSCTQEVTEVVFKNTYTTENGIVNLTAQKDLTGREMQANEFDFVVTDASGEVITRGSNAADGSVSFSSISYTHSDLGGETSKEFAYWMYENVGNAGGVTYDMAKYKVVVKVTDNGNGALLTEVAYFDLNEDGAADADAMASYTKPVEKVVFRNSYAAEKASAVVNAEKTLSGKNLQAEEFSFVLTNKENANEVYTAKNTADGKIAFALEFENAGTYKYTLTETAKANDAVKGMGTYTFDSRAYTVIVTVTDDQAGKLHASVAYMLGDASAAEVAFNNSYIPAPLTVDLSTKIDATKQVESSKADYSLAGFTFEVLDVYDRPVTKADGTPVIGISAADGKIAFDTFTFNTAGEYHYTVREKATSKGGVTIDTQVWELHIHITNNVATGNLEVHTVKTSKVDSNVVEKPVFVNMYQAEPVEITIKAGKKLQAENGSTRTLKAGEFKFQVLEGDVIRAEAYNDAEGNITFTFEENIAGKHTYSIVEVTPHMAAEGIVYDRNVGTVVVEVGDDGEGQLKINGESVYITGNVITFTNKYVPKAVTTEITAKKLLSGAELTAGAFRFELVEQESGNVVAEQTNAADGKITFTKTFDQVGVYSYLIREVKGTDANITYDTAEYTAVVQVTDDESGRLEAKVEYSDEAVFKNIFTPPAEEVPDDGRTYKSYTFTKEWVDNNNQNGKRPESITLELYQDGVYVCDTTLRAEEGWVSTVILMASNKDHEYTWTIKEKDVPEGYVVSYVQSGYKAINTLKSLTKTGKVSTGDSSGLGLFMGLSAATLAAAGWMVLTKLRKRNR